MMTPEQQRIAIAEWMGWKLFYNERTLNQWNLSKDGKVVRYLGDTSPGNDFTWQHVFMSDDVPDYPNDLNAMHEAESKLTDIQFAEYCSELQCVIIGSRNPEPEKLYLKSMLPASKLSVRATPQQRSEALCRTLWPERFEK